jgi:hypothetical protein
MLPTFKDALDTVFYRVYASLELRYAFGRQPYGREQGLTYSDSDFNRTIFWNITLCSLLKVNRRFGGTPQLGIWFYTGFLFSLVSNPEDVGDMSFWNVCWLTQDYTATYAEPG